MTPWGPFVLGLLSLGLLLPLTSPAHAASKTIAILPIDARLPAGAAGANSPDDALVDAATRVLGATEWQVISRERTDEVAKRKGYFTDACKDGSCRLAVARALKASQFLSSSLQSADGGFKLSLRLIDTRTGLIRGTEEAKAVDEPGLWRATEAAIRRLVGQALMEAPEGIGRVRMTILSEPAGANVHMDSEEWGETPVTKRIDPGEHLVTIDKKGYAPVTMQLRLSEKKEQTLSRQLRRSEGATTASDGPLFAIPLDDSPTRGPATAKVTLVEWADFQCPYCQKAAATLLQIAKTYGDDVRFVFKQNPLPSHADAMPAAQASLAAAEQGKFWEMHDRLFQNRDHLQRVDLDQYAFEMGLDMKRFEAAFDSPSIKDAIRRDQKEAGDFDARGTPVFFLNGRKIVGAQPFETFEQLIDDEVIRADRLLASGTKPTHLYGELTRHGLTRAPSPDNKDDHQPPAEKPPPARVAKVDRLGDSPVRGPNDARVTIVEFSDFQCPFCGRAWATMERIRRDYPRDVRFVFKHNPLPFHPNALPSALASLAAGNQGKFWEFHDLAFQHQTELSPKKYEEWATQLHLNMDRFELDIDNPDTKDRVIADVAYARQLNAGGTPTFFIDGRAVIGAVPYENFKSVIDEEIVKANALLKSGIPAGQLYERLLSDNVASGSGGK